MLLHKIQLRILMFTGSICIQQAQKAAKKPVVKQEVKLVKKKARHAEEKPAAPQKKKVAFSSDTLQMIYTQDAHTCTWAKL